MKECRARVFLLTADNEWTDVATGLCQIPTHPATGPLLLTILSDTPNATPSATLYQLAVHPDTDLSVQQETVISWTRPEDGVDVAVSFETQAGCERVWANLCRFQGKPHDPRPDSESEDGDGTDTNDTEQPLPQVVDKTTLPDIDSVLGQACQMPFVKRSMSTYLLEQHYIERLLSVAVETDNISERLLSNIFKNIFLLNSAELIKEMLQEPHVFDIASLLEHLDDTSSKGYKEYLMEAASVSLVVKVKSMHILSLIRETFYAQYFKDVILPRHLDDDTFTTMVMLIRSNHMDIVTGMEAEGEIYEQLGEQLGRLVRFMEAAMKPNQSTTATIEHQQQLRIACADLLLCISQHDPSVLRQIIIDSCRESSGRGGLLLWLVEAAVEEHVEAGCRWHLVYLIRTIVDSTTTGPNSNKTMDDLLNLFYPFYATRLLQPLIDIHDQPEINHDLIYLLLDLLTFFIQSHKFRIKYLLLRSFLIQNITTLLDRHPSAVLQAAVVRLFRAMLSTSDDFYTRFFAKHHTLAPLIRLFTVHDSRNNLLESALFDFFEAVRASQCSLLIAYVVETAEGRKMRNLENNLWERFKQAYDAGDNCGEKGRDEEEQYFERLDDQDEQRPASPSKKSKLEYYY